MFQIFQALEYMTRWSQVSEPYWRSCNFVCIWINTAYFVLKCVIQYLILGNGQLKFPLISRNHGLDLKLGIHYPAILFKLTQQILSMLLNFSHSWTVSNLHGPTRWFQVQPNQFPGGPLWNCHSTAYTCQMEWWYSDTVRQ